MSGIRIGFGVGLRYSYPTATSGNVDVAPPVETDITDGVLLESGNVILLESGNYVKREDVTDAAAESRYVKSKSYWNF